MYDPPSSYTTSHRFRVHALCPCSLSDIIGNRGGAPADKHIHNKHLLVCFIIVHEGQVDTRTGAIRELLYFRHGPCGCRVLPMAVQPFRDEIDTIVLTHCHFDHTAHLKEISHLCRAKIAIHRDDAGGLIDDGKSLSMQFGARSPGVVPDIVTFRRGRNRGPDGHPHAGHTPGSALLLGTGQGAHQRRYRIHRRGIWPLRFPRGEQAGA